MKRKGDTALLRSSGEALVDFEGEVRRAPPAPKCCRVWFSARQMKCEKHSSSLKLVTWWNLHDEDDSEIAVGCQGTTADY